MNRNTHTEVLVVGAGPVGMTAAVLLAAHGIRVCIVERNATTADDPKAISLDDESLRAFQRAGIADDVMSVIVPGTGTTYYGADGEELFHGGAAVPFRAGFPFKNPFAQPDLERVLRRALDAHPLIDLRFATELVDFDQHEGGLRAAVVGERGAQTIDAQYLLGADGGRSQVRATLGIPMEGRSHDDVWLVIDCLEDEHRQRYGMHHADPARPHVIVPGLHGRCRYEFFLHSGEGEPTSDPPFALIERLLAPYRGITPGQVERAVSYRFHGLNAVSWQSGRAFLLGDAAHMMPPFAGQGLNSGIRDAANLTWKIAAVLRGQSSPDLLDTYTVERRPHAQAVIRSSERLGRVVMTTNARLARFRDAIVREALGHEEGRVFFEEMRYRPSPRITRGLIAGEDHPLVGLAIGQPRVFDFQRHRIVALDDLLGVGWAVLGIGMTEDDGPWERAATAFAPLTPRLVDVPLDDMVYDRPEHISVAIDVDGRLLSEVDSARGCLLVIRPDRVIAAVVTPTEIEPAASTLNRFLRSSRPIGASSVQ